MKKQLYVDNMKIDFVIPWVDGFDKKWQEEKFNLTGIATGVNDERYRDWGILKYWFRAVEKNAPWVNNIFFITYGHLPKWLNINNSKLKVIKHDEYIPKEYLPTFSSHPIELNFHRIKDLSEHFVYFNDDMFINSNVDVVDFFENGEPKLSAVLSTFVPTIVNDTFIHCLCNNISFANKHFKKKKVIRRDIKKWYNFKYGKYVIKNIYNCFSSEGFSMIQDFHNAAPMLKSTYEKVWELEPELLHKTSLNKLRSHTDVNQYIMTYYNICMGKFEPKSPYSCQYYELKNSNTRLLDDISKGKHKFICINDSAKVENIESVQNELIATFEKRYPEKSTFEI